MNFYTRRFNLYLLLFVAMAAAAGCATEKKADEKLASLRIHIQSSSNPAENNKTVSVLRADPLLVPISNDPILTEASISQAQVIETQGGFALQLKFDQAGAWILEQYTAANPGKHLVIFGQWSDEATNSRWLAVPLISRRNATGTLTFTPDASREECDELVVGLNNVARKVRKAALK